jgi:hypothetical protein
MMLIYFAIENLIAILKDEKVSLFFLKKKSKNKIPSFVILD